MTRRTDSESVGHAVTKAAKRESASTAALSAALYDATSDFPDDSDGCSSPAGGACNKPAADCFVHPNKSLIRETVHQTTSLWQLSLI
jgi:hypothetical protein